jgi:hypothetical protein
VKFGGGESDVVTHVLSCEGVKEIPPVASAGVGGD